MISLGVRVAVQLYEEHKVRKLIEFVVRLSTPRVSHQPVER